MSNRLAMVNMVGQVTQHVTEPIADQTLRYILSNLGLTDLMKDHIYLVSDFRKTSLTTDAAGNPVLSVNRVVARLTPSLNPANNKWEGDKTAVDLGNGNTLIRSGTKTKKPWTGKDFTKEEFSVFHDDDTFTDITEWNVGSTFQMEVKMDFKSISQAHEILAKIFATFQNGEMIGYVPLVYDYPVPMDIQRTLFHIYTKTDLPQTQKGYEDWIRDRSGGAITWNTNREDLRIKEMVVKRTLGQSMYLIECTQDSPENTEHVSTITMNVTVQYSRTNRLVFEYPIIVNNQFLPFKFCWTPPQFRYENKGPIQWQNSAVDAYWKSQYPYKNLNPIPYPWWDNWELPSDSIISAKGYRPLMIMAFTLDDADNPNGVTKIDVIDGLPGYKLCDEFKAMLQESKASALYTSGAYVNLSVFAHDFQVDQSLLDFDGTILTIKSRRKTPIYRLVISANPKPINKGPLPQNLVWINTIIPKKS